jgi:hypothetical protein
VELAPEGLLERLARVCATGRNLDARGRVVAMFEDEQLRRAVTFARDVRDDTLSHFFSDAL